VASPRAADFRLRPRAGAEAANACLGARATTISDRARSGCSLKRRKRGADLNDYLGESHL